MKNKDKKRIERFIKEHHVLTLATCNNAFPYCANCFYVWLSDEWCFLFTSDSDTKHIEDAETNDIVAGSVVLETEKVGLIRGLQFQGRLNKVEKEFYKNYRKLYLKAYPFAVIKKTDLWLLKVDYMKLTDNRLGFGTKIINGELKK